MHGAWLDYAIVAILGALVGGGELVSRYRDSPAGALRSRPAAFYIALNSLPSLAALFISRVFHWQFGVTSGDAAVRWTQVCVAGAGAMALFRSSLFTVHTGDREIGVGPSSFLQVFRAAADRAVDRLRARDRSLDVSHLMEGIAYDKAAHGRTAYCLALMQNVPDEDQVALNQIACPARRRRYLPGRQGEDSRAALDERGRPGRAGGCRRVSAKRNGRTKQ